MKKSTINKILRYKFTKEEKEAFLESGIINGCGGKGGFSFDSFVKREIEFLPNFDRKKAEKLYKDIRELCYEHDFDFHFGKSYITFLLANLRFAKGIFCLLHWLPLTHRGFIFSVVFFTLMKKGYKYFNAQ